MKVQDTVIVIESPNKVKKFREITGAKIIATVGHFRDMAKNELGIDMETYMPKWQLVAGKSRLLEDLRQCNGKKVVIATDPDREGYAIGTHVYELIKLRATEIMRAEVYEVTEKGILAAIEAAVPFERTNNGLYNAFLGRRVGDRLIGYFLSPLVSNQLNQVMSVGRVQSPALRLVVERENEIIKHVPSISYPLILDLLINGSRILAVHEDSKNIDKEQAGELLIKMVKVQEKIATVISSKTSRVVQPAKPPLTTSTLQQAASNRLNLAPEQTMSLAQGLFEKGLITYHRTDSVRIGAEKLEQLREMIISEYGEEYCPERPNDFSSKKSQAEAHEAIRPTLLHSVAETENLVVRLNGLSKLHSRLYELILTRTISSQMTWAQFDHTIARLEFGDEIFIAKGSIRVFDGHQRVYNDIAKTDEDSNENMPELAKGNVGDVKDVVMVERKTKAKPRYTEATLIRELENKGIGRPSTYASILKTLKERNYVQLDKKKLVPTETGKALIECLQQKSAWVVDYELTREIESRLDAVQEKSANWQEIVKEIHLKLGNNKKPVAWNVLSKTNKTKGGRNGKTKR